MSVDETAPRSRRAVLAAALGGLGAVIASRLASPQGVSATNGDAVTVGSVLSGTSVTALTNTGSGTALSGAAADGAGVWGTSQTNTPSDFTGGNRTGVIGVAGSAVNLAPSTDEVGVYGYSDISGNAVGSWGDSPDGAGVLGTGYWGVYGNGQIGVEGDVYSGGTGVYGFTGDVTAPTPPGGVGVQATAATTSQVALNVT